VTLGKMLRNGMIGALMTCVPVASGIAATRPNAAVPMASSTASSAAMGIGDEGDSIGWIGLAVGVVLIALFAVLVLDNDDDDDEDAVSAG
jgi:hypothetical protein